MSLKNILVFFDVDGVLNDYDDFLLRKELFASSQFQQSDCNLKFLYSGEYKEEKHLGFVSKSKLKVLTDIANQYHTFNWLISSWGVFSRIGLVSKEEMEKFFELKLNCDAQGCGYSADQRLEFTYQTAQEFAIKNNVSDVKQIKIIYIDDLNDFSDCEIKEKFSNEFDVLFIHPSRTNKIDSIETKKILYDFLNK